MLKILRKYKQWLFFGFMGFLAVAWLLPNAGGGNRDATSAAKEVVGHVGDSKVRLMDLNLAEAEYGTLQQYFRDILPLDQLVGVKVENGYHWLLLAREAEQGGFVGGASDGADWIPELTKAVSAGQAQMILQRRPQDALMLVEQTPAGQDLKAKQPQLFEILAANPQIIPQIPAVMGILTDTVESRVHDVLERVRANGNDHLSKAQIPGIHLVQDPFDLALAKVRGVRRMANAFFGAPRISDKRLESVALERLNQAVIDCTLIPAERLKRQIADPTPEQLAAHFEKYKAEKPGDGLLGIGYLQPQRVQLEYMKIDRKAMEAAIKVDEVEVNKRWRTNRDRYKGEFAEERPNVESAMRSEAVQAAMAEAVRIARAEILRGSKKFPEDGAYRQLPADWMEVRTKLSDVAAAIQSTIKTTQGLDIPAPTVVVRTDAWLPLTNVAELDGIGKAAVQIGPRREVLGGVLSHLREFAGRNDFALQMGIPYPTEKALEDAEGSAYIFNVLGVKKVAPAETLEEVKTQAVSDYKLAEAYTQLLADSQKYIDKTVADGLDGLAKAFERAADDPATGAGAEKALDVLQLAEVDSQYVLAKGRPADALMIPEFITAVRDVAAKLDPKAPPAIGELAKGEAVKGRVVAVAIPKARGLAIALVVASRPVTVEKLRGVGYQGIEATLSFKEVLNPEGNEKQENPFAYDVMKQRMQFTLTKEVTREEKPADSSDKSNTPADGAASTAPAGTPAK